jgi:hypothetical protein
MWLQVHRRWGDLGLLDDEEDPETLAQQAESQSRARPREGNPECRRSDSNSNSRFSVPTTIRTRTTETLMAKPEKRIRNGKVRWYARYRDPEGKQRTKTFRTVR